uniref:Glucuronosyltransferase n=1 Tax=Meloidogyne javanica TaxID=6303 RepID=A0A915LSL5_MELJA
MDDKRIVQFRDFGLGNISVDSFVFGISRGGDLNWLERAFFVDKIRHIVDQFPKFNVTVFDYDSTIYDLILGVKVTMINLLMAIGLSVDFSAHICYHFDILQEKQKGIQTESPIKNIKIFEQKEIEKRIEQILEVVGRPMLEAVISTIICIFPLFFISIEIIASFARTVLFLGD